MSFLIVHLLLPSRAKRSLSSRHADRTLPITVRRPGAYAWRVVLPADTYNQPVVLCGGGFRVR